MGSIGVPELLIILVILLLLFGASKLPRLARSLGEAKKEFDEAVTEVKRKPGDTASSEPASGDASKAGSSDTESEKAAG